MPTSFTYRLAIAGVSGAGKTCLLRKLLNPKATHSDIHTTTIGATLGRYIHPGNRDIEILIWDTAGDQRCISLHNFYLRNMDLVIFTIDCQSNNEQFQADLKYLTDASRYINRDESECILVFTKNDSHTIELSYERINLAKNTLEVSEHLVCSAKDNLHIDELKLKINNRATAQFNIELEKKAQTSEPASVVKKIGFWDNQISTFGFWSRHKTSFKIMSIGTLGIFLAFYKATQCLTGDSSNKQLTRESNSSTRNLPFPAHPWMYSDMADDLDGVTFAFEPFDSKNALKEPLMLSLNQSPENPANRHSIQPRK